jgi:hypothetical protein
MWQGALWSQGKPQLTPQDFIQKMLNSIAGQMCLQSFLLSGWSLNFYQRQILGNASDTTSFFAVLDLMYKLTITLMVSLSLV